MKLERGNQKLQFEAQPQLDRTHRVESKANVLTWILLAMMGLALSGCHSMKPVKLHRPLGAIKHLPVGNAERDSTSSTLVGKTDARVAVGGQVRQPQQVDALSDLTLGRAIALSGGLVGDADEALMLARLRRGHGILKQDLFIPYHYVVNGLASEIRVSAGDEILILDARSTPLNHQLHESRTNAVSALSAEQRSRSTFSIGGMVANPGGYHASDFRQPMVRWRELFSSSMIEQHADLAIVRRRSPTGIGKPDVFLLPLDHPAFERSDDSRVQLQRVPTSAMDGANGPAPAEAIRPTFEDILEADQNGPVVEDVRSIATVNELFVLPGDQVVFTRASTVPLIAQGLTAPIAEKIHEAFDRIQRLGNDF